MTIGNEDMGILEGIANEIADAMDGTRTEYHIPVERMTDYTYDKRAITELILRAVLDELAYRELISSGVKTTRDYEIGSARFDRNKAAAANEMAEGAEFVTIDAEDGEMRWVPGHRDRDKRIDGQWCQEITDGKTVLTARREYPDDPAAWMAGETP